VEELPVENKIEQILLLEDSNHDVRKALESIVDQLPSISLTEVNNLEIYKQKSRQENYDVVIFDYDVSREVGLRLINELKLKDYEPAVLIVSSSVQDKVFTEIYNHGLHQYIVKQGNWKDELGPAIRHLLRIRKLENENRNLLAKLTEANALLNEKNRRLDEFSAMLAHDIRGPLGGICMKLEYILDSYKEKFDDRLTGMLSRAQQASERLTHIVQAMYDFAKLGSKATQMEYVELIEVVQGVVADLSVDENLDINLFVDEKLPKVWGNKQLLSQVFLNLIQNAIKYNDKPKIAIQIKFDNLVSKTLGEFAQISISDNGMGIPVKAQKEIFHIFSRGINSNSSKEGLGLGLSVVQRIIELHFGKIWVESEEKKGTTFYLMLPNQEISFAL
jgi:signal transduction histidine kinase